MTRDYFKVKRGMVFSYNIDQSVDKLDVKKITLAPGKEIEDYRMYGWRGFLVVSSDEDNIKSPICTIVPISSKEKPDRKSYVQFNQAGKTLTIICEQLYTVNTLELFKYMYTVSDPVMDQVDKALATHLNLSLNTMDSKVRMSLDQIESIIQGIINQKVEEMMKTIKAPSVDIEDAVNRLGAGLENLFQSQLNNPKPEESEDVVEPIKSSDDQEKPLRKKEHIHKNQIEKFYDRYPDKAPKVEDANKRKYTKSDKPRRKWTLESMQEFMDDANRMSSTEMVRAYQFEDVAEYHRVKYYVMNRLEGVLRSAN